MKSLKDRNAFVTGAASGIGRALAIALAAQGCHLYLVDVNEEGLRSPGTGTGGDSSSRVDSTVRPF
jgi:NAD(P)-dependent dehydrogenase (short-subunit alcohol dehydrogenase family)